MAPHHRRYAHGQGVGGYDHLVGNDGPRPDRGAGAHHDVVEDDGPRAHQAAVFKGATFQMGEMTDDAVLADTRRETRSGVDDGAVLDRGAGPDRDLSVVTTEDGRRPHGGLRSEADGADHHRLGVDISLGVDAGHEIFQGVDGHGRGK